MRSGQGNSFAAEKWKAAKLKKEKMNEIAFKAATLTWILFILNAVKPGNKIGERRTNEKGKKNV